MQEHMKRYRLYQQKVREYERLQKLIEEETGKSWREIGGLTDLEEVYGPIVAMMTSRLKKLEYPAQEEKQRISYQLWIPQKVVCRISTRKLSNF
jgi:hypothetical protein